MSFLYLSSKTQPCRLRCFDGGFTEALLTRVADPAGVWAGIVQVVGNVTIHSQLVSRWRYQVCSCCTIWSIQITTCQVIWRPRPTHTETTMERIRTSVLAMLFAFTISLPLSAQHVADQAILDQVLADHVRTQADDRQAIRRLLEMEQVREIAHGAGLDLKRADAAVAALDDDDLVLIAAQARAANDALAGGQSTVTISTTVIIIGLLVLILLIVAI